MEPRPFSSYRNIVVLTGAGISVASGLRPYRGPDGVWTEHNVEEYGHVDSLDSQPDKVWALFGRMRELIVAARPNAGHLALAAFEAALNPDQDYLLVTQNVDGLHQRAGSKRVVELHGTLERTRCNDPVCTLPPFVDAEAHLDAVPHCPRCGSLLRPDIVLFGEPVDLDAGFASKRALRDCDLFIAIGTSGLVTPAANFLRSAEYAGARTVLVNLESMPADARPFGEQHLGRAEELLPRLMR